MSEEVWNKRTPEQVGKREHEVFEKTLLPYVDAAYNLARWLTRSEHDAEDIVQESFLRAMRSFGTFIPGRDARAWLLAIVRNCCRTWLKRKGFDKPLNELDESVPATELWSDPEAVVIDNMNSQLIRRAVEELPLEYREVLILRELEELSYKEIAQILEIPLGTVMSRLSRSRRELHGRLCNVIQEGRK
ncbi:MAG: sigma-70 family RNA polymerase sigma factor [Acidobacteriaceae bacterium]|nr:sigma-70 family RNA polymerase sigma factor [Acidobacteriaceae bacterium]MBV9781271.1 sigma-70 family RNA polymerase sigma factor [Acidobacteriaceae bacterium]